MFKRISKCTIDPFLLSLCVILLIFTTNAVALTRAGLEIRNQSVATYTLDGNPYTTTSNEVITTVAPVYSFEILPNTTPGYVSPGDFSETAALSQEVAPGTIVYYSYYLMNTGNTSDSFLLKYINNTNDDANPVTDTIKIYQDIGGDGKVDSGDKLLLNSSSVGNDVFGGAATNEVAHDKTIALIVEFRIPATAQNGWSIDLDIDGLSQGDPNITDAVSNYNQTVVSDQKGILTIRKSVNLAEAKPGDILDYTISGSNTGNAPVKGKNLGSTLIDINGDGASDQLTGVFIYDFLPDPLNPGTGDSSNITQVTGAPQGSTVLYTDGTDRATAQWRPLTLIGSNEITGIALFIPDNNPGDTTSEDTLQMGQGYALRFSIPIDNSISSMTIINIAYGEYNDGDPLVSEDKKVTSNESRTDISEEITAGVRIGPMTDPDALLPQWQGSLTSANHPKIDDPLTDQNESLTFGDDVEQTVGDRHAGQSVYFVNTILNTGSATDTFNIFVIPQTGWNASYTIQILKSDGLTPLSDSTMDSFPDTGKLAPAEHYNVVIKVIIPGYAITNLNPQDILISAKSTNDTTVEDSTVDRITTILQASVDMAKHALKTGLYTGDGDPNDNPSSQSSGCPLQPYYDFALDVENVYPDGTESGGRDTYVFEIQNGLNRADWSYMIYKDLNNDGILNDNELNPISNTNDLNPWDGVANSGEGESTAIILRITPPRGLSAGIYDTTLQATSTLNEDISDRVTLTIIIEECRLIDIEPDGSRTSVAGGTVTFCHEVTNLGNTTEQWDLLYTSTEGFTAVFIDANGKTIGETATIGIDYLAGNGDDANLLDPFESVNICLKLFVPADATDGTTDIITVTVTDANRITSNDALDLITVIAGNLELIKTASHAEIEPTPLNADTAEDFHPLTYTTLYTNKGDTEIDNLEIIDAIPSNTRTIVETNATDGVSAPSCAGCIQMLFSNDGGLNWNYIPTTQSDHSDPAVTHIKWEIGTIGAGSSGNVAFQVLVD